MPSPTTAVVTTEEPKAIAVIRGELEKRERDLLAVLPPGMDPQRFMRVSLLAISKNPDLLNCTPGSLIRSIIEAAEIGLEPTGSLNRAWLVGFKPSPQAKPEAQLMIGYQGYADLMRDSGKISRITAEAVYEGDHFKVVKGSDPHVEHEPAYGSEDPTKITHFYAIAWFTDGGQQFEVMTKAQVDGIRAKSRSKNSPAWTQSYAQMGRKSVLRRLSNYTPLSARAINAISRDDEREFGPGVQAPVVSRNAEIRTLLAAKGVKGAAAASEAPGATETGNPPDNALESASAKQQTGDDAPADEKGGGEAVCGATSDPQLGDVETCVLPPGHLEAKDAKKRHEGASGSVWPA